MSLTTNPYVKKSCGSDGRADGCVNKEEKRCNAAAAVRRVFSSGRLRLTDYVTPPRRSIETDFASVRNCDQEREFTVFSHGSVVSATNIIEIPAQVRNSSSSEFFFELCANLWITVSVLRE